MVCTLSPGLKRVLALFAAGFVGLFAVFPHPLNHPAEFLGQVIVIALSAVLGARLVSKTVLRSPVLDAALARRRAPPYTAPATLSIGIGLVTTLALIAADTLLLKLSLPGAELSVSPPAWTGALYAAYGGLFEEVVFHYGLFTALVVLAQMLISAARSYWLAIGVSSLALGVFHLPNAGALLPITPFVVTRTIVAGFAVGATSGWLYWRHGLESAMVAHAIFSFGLHVAAPGAFD